MCWSYWKGQGLYWGRSCLVRHVWILGRSIEDLALVVLISVIPFPFRPVSLSISIIPSYKSITNPAAIFSSTRPPFPPASSSQPQPKNEIDVTPSPKPTQYIPKLQCLRINLWFRAPIPISIPATPVDPARPNDLPRSIGTGHTEACLWLVRRAGTPFRHIQGQERKRALGGPYTMHMHANLKSRTNGKVLGGTAVESEVKWSRKC